MSHSAKKRTALAICEAVYGGDPYRMVYAGGAVLERGPKNSIFLPPAECFIPVWELFLPEAEAALMAHAILHNSDDE